jgi:hypothetical protein
MAFKEVLRGIIFLHRVADHKDFNEVVNCVPDDRMRDLEQGLIARQNEGEIETIQIGRHRTEIHPLSPVADGVDEFFAKIDSVRLHSSTDRTPPSEGEGEFTGFDDVNECP